jgi:hypothetical protein
VPGGVSSSTQLVADHPASSECWIAVSNILVESVFVANSMTHIAARLEESR